MGVTTSLVSMRQPCSYKHVGRRDMQPCHQPERPWSPRPTLGGAAEAHPVVPGLLGPLRAQLLPQLSPHHPAQAGKERRPELQAQHAGRDHRALQLAEHCDEGGSGGSASDSELCRAVLHQGGGSSCPFAALSMSANLANPTTAAHKVAPPCCLHPELGTHQLVPVPLKGSLPIIVPARDAPQRRISLKQHRCCLKKVEEVRAEQHVILNNDDMAVIVLQEHAVQAPAVVLGQPGVSWLQTAA